MSEHAAVIRWSRQGDDFLGSKYSRAHTWSFDGGLEIHASSSPHVVPPPFSVASHVDPEEAYVASLSSCHMLWFLAIAAQRRVIVDGYVDEAVGVMERDPQGRLAITRVTLRPQVLFSPDTPVFADRLERMHEMAHRSCFIANSVKTEITVEPR